MMQPSSLTKNALGRISEWLLDVYIRTKKLKYAELPVIDIEPVNWVKKGSGFLMAKFFGKRYEVEKKPKKP